MSKKVKRNELLSWECLRQLEPKELRDVVGFIQSGEVIFSQKGLECAYPTNEDILKFAEEVFKENKQNGACK